jgi:hypothetical protein
VGSFRDRQWGNQLTVNGENLVSADIRITSCPMRVPVCS